jgi:ketosteroid isomerase-like protein
MLRHNEHVEAAANPATSVATAHEVVVLEEGALRRWLNGDPGGFLELCAEDVVYFDPFQERRIDGLEALTVYYELLRGKIRAARFDLLNPLVQEVGDAATLTFNFVSFDAKENPTRWNCTEVYRRQASAWKLIQSHWSFTNGGRRA